MYDRDRLPGGGDGGPSACPGGGPEGGRPGGDGESGGAVYCGAAGVRDSGHSAGWQHSWPGIGLCPQRQYGRRVYLDPASVGPGIHGNRLCGGHFVHLQHYGAVFGLSARPAGGGNRPQRGVAACGPGQGRAVHSHPAAGETAPGLCMQLRRGGLPSDRGAAAEGRPGAGGCGRVRV